MMDCQRETPRFPRFPAMGKPTALVVDDETWTRRATVQALERFGFLVLSAHSAEGAEERARELDGPLDLLVSKATLSDGRADVLARRMQVEGLAPNILFTSSLAREELLSLGFTALRAPVLSRPFDDVELAERVRSVLGL